MTVDEIGNATERLLAERARRLREAPEAGVGPGLEWAADGDGRWKLIPE